jgi:hypothetical protein
MRRVAIVTVLGLSLGIGGGATFAAFSWTTANHSNSFATDTDWTTPTGSSVIGRTGSATGGYIAQGSAYRVYANATDSGNPASGIGSVTANVRNITAGQTTVPLTTTGGPWTIDGVSYAYRSVSLTADNPLAPGPTTYSLTVADAHSPANSATQTFSVRVDNAGPAAVDIQANVGNGIPETGDTFVFTFSEAMDSTSILSGWAGAGTTVQVLLRNGGCGANDSATALDTAGGTGVHLGTVCTGDVVNGNRTFATSTMAMFGATVTLTLGGNPGGTKAAANTGLSWTPSTLATDVAGNAASPAAVNESGPVDTDL